MTACDEKTCYRSKPLAFAAVASRLRDNPTLYLRVYLCNACGLWHLTHKEDRFPRKRKEVA